MFLQLRSEDRKQANTHYLAGVSYQKQERYDKAEEEYLKAIAIDPQCYKAYCNLGSIYLKIGREDEGLAFKEKALEINPDDSITLFGLGMFYMTHDEEDKGLTHFSRAIASDRSIEQKIYQWLEWYCYKPKEEIAKLLPLIDYQIAKKRKLKHEERKDKLLHALHLGGIYKKTSLPSSITAGQEYTTYNNAKFNFSMNIPEGWKNRSREYIVGSEEIFYFTDQNGASIHLVVGPTFGMGEAIDELEVQARGHVKRLGAEFESCQRIYVDAVDAIEIVYFTYPRKNKKVGFVKEGMEYIIHCAVQDDLFDEYVAIFDKCISSFKFKTSGRERDSITSQSFKFEKENRKQTIQKKDNIESQWDPAYR